MENSRREFLKNAIGLCTGIGVGGATLGSTVLTLYGGLKRETDSQAVIEKNSEKNEEAGELIDIKIKNMPFKLYGVSHSREFAETYYNSIDKLVRNANIVVSEGEPYYRDNSYFMTVAELCKKHKKPVIYLDPQSSLGIMAEAAAGTMGAVLATLNAPEIIKSSSRREFIKHSLKTTAGLYLFMGSFINSMAFKYFMVKEGDTSRFLIAERFYYGHIIDQRNVEISNRLFMLPGLLSKKDLNRGDYTLFTYGRYHLDGISYYLKNPFMRRLKTKMYSLTYNLIDEDGITKYSCNAAGIWEKEPLK